MTPPPAIPAAPHAAAPAAPPAAMSYRVHHHTVIQYAGLVRLAQFNLRLEPAPWAGQVVTDYRLAIDPAPSAIRQDRGPFLVEERRLVLREPIARLEITSSFCVTVAPPPVDYAAAASPPIAQIRRAALASPDLSRMAPASYLFSSPIAAHTPAIGAWASRFFGDDTPVIAARQALMAAIHSELTYDADPTRTDTPAAEAFAKRHGVCQDFAHVLIVAARAHGIPAAYVSGYLRTLPPPGKPRLVGADAMHAWAALWCGDVLGWVGFDPTNDIFATTDHIFVAMGRDYSDVAPLDGVFHGGGDQAMRVAVDVEPIAAAAITD